MKRYKLFHIAAVVLLLTVGASCGDGYLDQDMTEYATKDQINDLVESGGGDGVVNLMNSIMLGAYNTMIAYQGEHDVFGEMSVGLSGDLMTEDMIQDYVHYFAYDYQLVNNAASYRRTNSTWSYLYSMIGKCNEVIEKVPTTTTEPALKGVLGEALALRAYGYITLAQRFQQTYIGNEDKPGIPLTLTSNDDRESIKGRGTLSAVYDKILTDYKLAVELLSDAPERKKGTKTNIDKQVAAGLYARALMVVEDWENAAKYANMARQGYPLMTADQVATDGFNNINNVEWMWGADITGENTTVFASFFSHVCSYDAGYGESTFAPKLIDARLYKQMGDNDVRKAQFKSPDAVVDGESSKVEENAPSYCNFKFKKVTGWLADYLYMRASEMYLIEAEALAHQENSNAYTVLKELMDNRDPDWSTKNTTATVDECFLQKRLELWGEGRIYYDYKRLKKDLNRNYAGTNHSEKLDVKADSWKLIYQIPQTEIDNNEDLTEADQNPLGE